MFSAEKSIGDPQCIRLSGEIDIYTAQDFQKPVEALIEEGVETIRLDMTDLTYIDSTAIGILIELKKASQEAGIDLVIVNPRKNIRKLLELTGVNKILKITKGDSNE